MTSPRQAPWTLELVRRATPFAAIAVIFAVQAAGAGPVLAFPLYLTVNLITALQMGRAATLAVAGMSSVAILVPELVGGQSADLLTAILLAAVLMVVAVALVEVVRRVRETASEALRRIEQIEARERRMRTMLEAATVGLALASSEGRLSVVNQGLTGILGRGRDELAQLTLSEVTDAEDRPSVEEALALLRAGDVSNWEAELKQVRGDGVPVPVAIALSTVSDPATGQVSLLVQATDISARVRQDGLRECLATVRQVMVGGPAWEPALPHLLSVIGTRLGWDVAQFWGVDVERGGLRVRYQWQRSDGHFDAFREAGSGLTITAGSGLLGRVLQSGVLAAAADLKQAPDYDRRAIARDSGLASVVAFPILDGGVVIGVIELLSSRVHSIQDDEVALLSTAGMEIGQFIRRTDVALALRRSEADHRAIFERSPIGIARISSEGDLLEANPALLAMLEQDLEGMRASAWPDLLRAHDQAAMRHRFAPLLAGITIGSTAQVRAATGSGKWLWLQLTATSIPDSNGRPEHLLVMIEDVTTVRETSDKLAEALESQRSANANLEKIDRTKTEFLSIVSHEFRTALTGIQGFSELIRDGGLEADEVRAYGGYIFNDADRINRLIGDMLDLDRMESGRMSIRTGDVDINEVLTEAIARAGTSVTAVEFKADLDPRLPIVQGDRDRLIQVVSNLVNNAVKYSPDGGTVTLSSRVDEGFALVSVTDTGLGIPPDEISHVFERFRRVRSGAAQSIPGTGLGLTIVKQIVEMHGGKIWVESAVGHGSAFHFTIPLAVPSVTTMQRRHG